MTSFSIGNIKVGEGEPPFLIAELSANHGGSLDVAKRTVEAAALAGAHAIKLQTYTPDTMTLPLNREPFIVGSGTPWTGRKLYSLYAEAMTPWDWHEPLFATARDCGISCFSSPFDASAVDFLREFNPPAVKIASFELVDHPLIESSASLGVPIIMSTGMATEEEISEAVDTASEAGALAIALLRCNSAYPAKSCEMDLSTITRMHEIWRVPIGLSDHTLTSVAAIVSVGLGAAIIEKHFILDRGLGGPDASFSLEPSEFSSFARDVREAWEALGGHRFGPSAAESASTSFRRSLWITADVKRGELISPANVRALRPQGGMHTKYLRRLFGKRFMSDFSVGTPFTLDCVEEP